MEKQTIANNFCVGNQNHNPFAQSKIQSTSLQAKCAFLFKNLTIILTKLLFLFAILTTFSLLFVKCNNIMRNGGSNNWHPNSTELDALYYGMQFYITYILSRSKYIFLFKKSWGWYVCPSLIKKVIWIVVPEKKIWHPSKINPMSFLEQNLI